MADGQSLLNLEFASAYGLTNPIAQTAMATAAIVASDDARESGPERLVELLGDGIAPLVGRDTRFALESTVDIVAWRLAQRVASPLASPAEEIALLFLADEARAQLEMAVERGRISPDEEDEANDDIDDLVEGLVGQVMVLKMYADSRPDGPPPVFALGDLVARLRDDDPRRPCGSRTPTGRHRSRRRQLCPTSCPPSLTTSPRERAFDRGGPWIPRSSLGTRFRSPASPARVGKSVCATTSSWSFTEVRPAGSSFSRRR